MIKEFVQMMKDEFGEVEYKATSNEGKIYRSKGYDKVEEDCRKRRRVDTEAFW